MEYLMESRGAQQRHGGNGAYQMRRYEEEVLRHLGDFFQNFLTPLNCPKTASKKQYGSGINRWFRRTFPNFTNYAPKTGLSVA